MTLPRHGSGKVFAPAAEHVTILGAGASIADYVGMMKADPCARDRTEIWTLNELAVVFDFDVLFHLHSPELVKAHEGRTVARCEEIGAKLVTPGWDLSDVEEEYPLAEVVEAFGDNYFDNSVAYMIAAAMLGGAKSIALYGADYNYAGMSVYEAGRCCVEYWVGRARQAGVQIIVPASTSLMEVKRRVCGGPSVYGYTRMPRFDQVEGKLALVGFDGEMPDDVG